MRITHHQKGDKLTIFIDGEIDHHNAAKIRLYIDDLLRNEKTRLLVFDFYNVSFMDSSGIGIVLGRYKIMQSMGGKVSIVNLSDKILKIFLLSGLDKLITIEQ